MKITGGSLRVKGLLSGADARGERWEEKAEQLRVYSGEKFRTLEEAEAGTVCAVAGLTATQYQSLPVPVQLILAAHRSELETAAPGQGLQQQVDLRVMPTATFPGQGLGGAEDGAPPELEPVLNYQLLLPEGTDPHTALQKLRQLSEEDPQLHILWNERLQQIHVRLMGQVQLEVLRRLIARRFGLEVDFGAGGILYKETLHIGEPRPLGVPADLIHPGGEVLRIARPGGVTSAETPKRCMRRPPPPARRP